MAKRQPRIPTHKRTKCEFNGIWFDSQAEKERYVQLCMLAKVGDIRYLEYHPCTVYLSDARISYKPDFVYRENGNVVYEDVKRGLNSERWPTIKKLWKAYGPGILRIATAQGSKGQLRFKIQDIQGKEIVSDDKQE